jgi:hypothetical protein
MEKIMGNQNLNPSNGVAAFHPQFVFSSAIASLYLFSLA